MRVPRLGLAPLESCIQKGPLPTLGEGLALRVEGAPSALRARIQRPSRGFVGAGARVSGGLLPVRTEGPFWFGGCVQRSFAREAPDRKGARGAEASALLPASDVCLLKEVPAPAPPTHRFPQVPIGCARGVRLAWVEWWLFRGRMGAVDPEEIWPLTPVFTWVLLGTVVCSVAVLGVFYGGVPGGVLVLLVLVAGGLWWRRAVRQRRRQAQDGGRHTRADEP